MKLLLDTNVLIDMLHGKAELLTTLEEAAQRGAEFTTSAVAVAEVYAGMRRGEEAQTGKVVQSMRCFPVTRAIAKRAGEMKMEWGKKGRTLTLTDTMIAATALEHDVLLVTKNRKDFPEDSLMFWPE